MTGPLLHTYRPTGRLTPGTWSLLILIVLIGGLLRFWGLDNIGLHGDEDVMALATRGILETGSPYIPSGMYYGRALPQLYLMAASVYAFGDSEWALRLPSVVIGTLAILIAYGLARRFLSVRWSLVFALIIALLPSMISLSQTARMYVFYVAFVMLFAMAIFRWERTGSLVDCSIAILTCLLALIFHSLAIFASFLFFYPGLVKRSWRLLALGAVAFAASAVSFKLVSSFISSQYFPLVSPTSAERVADSLRSDISVVGGLIGALLVAVSAGVVGAVSRKRGLALERTVWLTLATVCFVAAAVLAWFVQYHMAGFAFALGVVFYLRSGSGVVLPAAYAVLLLAAMATHAVLLWRSPEVQTTNDLLEALAGTPSPLPYLTFSGFSLAAMVVYGAVAIYFAIRFGRGKPLPDHVLFFLMSVLAPLFLIGFFEDRYVPSRYVIGLLPFFILAAFAGILDILGRKGAAMQPAVSPTGFAVASVILIGLFINPVDLWRNVNPQNKDFPYLADHRGVDHKGAAEFVLAQGLGADDLVIVVDSQQQGYYLRERMDYYMRSIHSGRNSSFMRNQKMFNLYTGIPQISTGQELAQILLRQNGGETLVIGSGEIAKNQMRYMADGIWKTMQAFNFEEVYLGRDGATRVWRYTPDRATTKRSAR